MGTDMGKKESLLFCLDRFLDPWFGYQLPYQDAIVDLLQVVIVSDNTLSVPDVSYAMHMDKEIETDS